jgi:hypothetical protein
LDFDGVLHPDAVYLERGRLVLRRDGVALFEWAPLLQDALAQHPEIKIVLASSWISLGFAFAKAHLPRPLQERVVGATVDGADNDFKWLTRYQQILRYVRRNQCSRWLAIDDDVETWGDQHRAQLVATDKDLGLAEPGKLDELAAKLRCLSGDRK